MKRIIAYYSQYSYEFREDTWRLSRIVKDEHDVFELMRECHLRDAGNRNDYPLVSCWGTWIEFAEEEYDICNSGHEHVSGRVIIKSPDYYEKARGLYDAWVARINRTIPHLREAYNKHAKDSEEKEIYEKWKKKESTNE